MSELESPLYVVVKETTVGSHAVAIFTSEKKAIRFLERAEMPDAEIEEHHVQGDYSLPDPLYAVETYDMEAEDYHFIGLYGLHPLAVVDAGEMGHTLRMTPDEKDIPEKR
jgi:hypothetical protein